MSNLSKARELTKKLVDITEAVSKTKEGRTQFEFKGKVITVDSSVKGYAVGDAVTVLVTANNRGTSISFGIYKTTPRDEITIVTTDSEGDDRWGFIEPSKLPNTAVLKGEAGYDGGNIVVHVVGSDSKEVLELFNARKLKQEKVIDIFGSPEDKAELKKARDIYNIIDDLRNNKVPTVQSIKNIASDESLYDGYFLPESHPKYKDILKLTNGKDGFTGGTRFYFFKYGCLFSS